MGIPLKSSMQIVKYSLTFWFDLGCKMFHQLLIYFGSMPYHHCLDLEKQKIFTFKNL